MMEYMPIFHWKLLILITKTGEIETHYRELNNDLNAHYLDIAHIAERAAS